MNADRRTRDSLSAFRSIRNTRISENNTPLEFANIPLPLNYSVHNLKCTKKKGKCMLFVFRKSNIHANIYKIFHCIKAVKICYWSEEIYFWNFMFEEFIFRLTGNNLIKGVTWICQCRFGTTIRQPVIKRQFINSKSRLAYYSERVIKNKQQAEQKLHLRERWTN